MDQDELLRVLKAFADVTYEVKEIEGVTIRVATPRTLYNLKKDTVRPLDRQDAEALRRRFGLEEM